MARVFISSAVNGLEEFRDGVEQMTEMLGYTPVRSENLGARPYSPRTACLSEVDTCDVFLLLLSKPYGYVTDNGISVTEEEFERAKAQGKPILAFIHDIDMEPPQIKFRSKVESYESGWFRGGFSSLDDLKYQVGKALKQYDDMRRSVDEAEAVNAFNRATSTLAGSVKLPSPRLLVCVFPQPSTSLDIISLTGKLDDKFKAICQAGICGLRGGYESLEDEDFTGLRTDKLVYAAFPNAIEVYVFDPTEKVQGMVFEDHFVPPKKIIDLSVASVSLSDANSAWVQISLEGMSDCCVGEHPGGNTVVLDFMWRDRDDAHFECLFAPLVDSTIAQWVNSVAGRLERMFKS